MGQKAAISRNGYEADKPYSDVPNNGHRITMYLHTLYRFSFYFCTDTRPIAYQWSCPRSGRFAQNAVYHLMSRDMSRQHVDVGWFSLFAAACLRESLLTRATALLAPFSFRTHLISRRGKFFSQAIIANTTYYLSVMIAPMTYPSSPNLAHGGCRVGSADTCRFSGSRIMSEFAYRTLSSSIAPNNLIRSAVLLCGRRSQTTPNTSPLHSFEKSLSLVTILPSSAIEMLANVLSSLAFFAFLKSTPRSERNSASSTLTFSSSKNRVGVDDDIAVASKRAGVI